MKTNIEIIAEELERTFRIRPESAEGVDLVCGFLRSPEFLAACERASRKLRALRPIELRANEVVR